MSLPRIVGFSRGGRSGYGALVEDGIVDLSARHGSQWPTLREVIEANALASLASLAERL